MRHLLVDVLHNLFIYLVHTTGNDKDICMFWISCIENSKPLDIIEWCQTGQYFNVTAITT